MEDKMLLLASGTKSLQEPLFQKVSVRKEKFSGSWLDDLLDNVFFLFETTCLVFFEIKYFNKHDISVSFIFYITSSRCDFNTAIEFLMKEHKANSN